MATDRANLERWLERERAQRRTTWKKLAEASGMSYQRLYDVRKTDNPISEDTKVGIEQLFGWGPGSVDRILAGGHPRAARSKKAAARDAQLQQLSQTLADLQEQVQRLREQYGDEPHGPWAEEG